MRFTRTAGEIAIDFAAAADYFCAMLSRRESRIALGLLVLYIAWGSTYLAMRVGVKTWPPFALAAFRFFLAGGIILLAAVLRGEPRPQNRRQVLASAVVGIILLGAGNGLVVWAVQWVPSGMTALFIATTMLWMAIFESLRPEGEPMTWHKLIGGLLGLAGVAVLMLPRLELAVGGELVKGQIGVLLAAAVWAAGSIFSRHIRVPRSTLYNAGMQMLAAALFQTMISIASGEWNRLSAAAWNPAAVLAILYLVLVGSCVGFVVYTFLMQNTSPAITATYAFVNPVVAVVLGAILLNENISANVIYGGALIIGSVLVLWLERWQNKPGPSK